MTNTNASWRSAFSVYAQPRVLGMILLGFSAGLPYSLVSSTLSAWLADEQISLSIIGYFSLVGIAYSIKVFWAPIIDRLHLPVLFKLLGMRRSWMLLSQTGIALGLLGISTIDAHLHLQHVAILAVCVAFCSATQDIAIDAYRIEAVIPKYQGAMAAMYVFGYRLALLAAGAGVLYIAEYFSWQSAYRFMACTMLVGIITTISISEPEHNTDTRTKAIEARIESVLGVNKVRPFIANLLKWFSDAVISPFVEFFQRNGKSAVSILMLIAVYKMSDMAMGVMAIPFYLDLGFSKKDIADISKVFGFFMTIIGTWLGGLLVVRFGIMRPLLLGAVLAALTNLLFAGLASSQPTLASLAWVISADNLSGGIAAASLIAYLSSLTNTAYTATQYALFSSLMTLPAKLVGSFSGNVAVTFGYDVFFIYSAIIGLPAIVLVLILMRSPLTLNPTNPENEAD
ncbi:MFS transporter [Methylomonas paludis]|uniref:MFS transporter n=1 Tax=Methylomonas paludis TaxID=1173101 RepID=A0A975MP64_9GAMM|nr:MFS transporter [Methylomonas paludis]QWF70929.1 MFS transporter [Methylomonas paludis]